MVITLGIPTSTTGAAACSDPVALPLVDAAFARFGGPEAQQLKKRFCARCEIAAQCLDSAMLGGEWGVWGGTGKSERTKHGARRPAARRR